MFKVINFVYNAGRERAYAEITAELRVLMADLPPTREAQLLREPIKATIGRLKAKLEGKEVDNGTDN